MDKSAIVDALEEIATLLELAGENPFKVRAYQNGARALDALDEDLETLVDEGRLAEEKGIGKALAEKIAILYREGRLPYLEELRSSVEPGLVELLEIPNLGPKKIKALREALGVDSIAALRSACESGQVAELKGFGKRTQEKLLQGIANREAYGKRHLWWKAREIADPILEGLRGLKEVEKASHAGSFRRLRETVGDLDFIVASGNPRPIMDWFVSQPRVAEVNAKGETKSSVRFEGGLQADLRIVPSGQYAFALHHFTGSKDHNVAMRQRALARGLSLSEWGLKPEDAESFDKGKRAATEKRLFQLLDLTYIPPELREGAGEIEAAEEGELPTLVETSQLRGVFHNHTTDSDGRASLEDMARAAADRGWEYWGVADHSKASFQANGLDENRLAAQLDEVRKLNASGRLGIRTFSGVECDILPDGRLDLEEELLMELDCVVVSVHASLGRSEAEMTRRLVKAIENPAATMLGHLTGRLLLRREGSKAAAARVIDAAAANGVPIEINANPQRLDMDWRHWRRAAEKGVLASVNPDAHRPEHFDFVEVGVNIARKGWLGPEQVLNTRPLDEVLAFMVQRRPHLGNAG